MTAGPADRLRLRSARPEFLRRQRQDALMSDQAGITGAALLAKRQFK